MTEHNGYEKQVLVTTDWLAERLGDGQVVVAEVDENPDLYDEGHIHGAVKLHWRDDLRTPSSATSSIARRSSASSASVASRTRRPSSSTATRTTGSQPSPTGT